MRHVTSRQCSLRNLQRWRRRPGWLDTNDKRRSAAVMPCSAILKAVHICDEITNACAKRCMGWLTLVTSFVVLQQAYSAAVFNGAAWDLPSPSAAGNPLHSNARRFAR